MELRGTPDPVARLFNISVVNKLGRSLLTAGGGSDKSSIHAAWAENLVTNR